MSEEFISKEQGGAAPGANKKMFLFGLGGLLLLALLIFLGVSFYLIYGRASTGSVARAVAGVLRLPAAKVNGQAISYVEYLDDLKAIHTMRGFDEKNGGTGAELTEEQMSDQVLWRLVVNRLLDEVARAQGITVNDTDLKGVEDQLFGQYQSLEELNAELKQRYGWDYETYKEKVIKPFLVQDKLAKKIAEDTTAIEQVRVQAEKVLAEVKAGGDFAALAKQYGQDGTAQNGGDLGWFGKGTMVPQFETAVFALEPGKVADNLVESPYGFHVVKLEEKRIQKVTGDDGKETEQEQARARHILFRLPGLDAYLDNLVKSARFNLYLRVHNPFADLQNQAR